MKLRGSRTFRDYTNLALRLLGAGRARSRPSRGTRCSSPRRRCRSAAAPTRSSATSSASASSDSRKNPASIAPFRSTNCRTDAQGDSRLSPFRRYARVPWHSVVPTATTALSGSDHFRRAVPRSHVRGAAIGEAGRAAVDGADVGNGDHEHRNDERIVTLTGVPTRFGAEVVSSRRSSPRGIKAGAAGRRVVVFEHDLRDHAGDHRRNQRSGRRRRSSSGRRRARLRTPVSRASLERTLCALARSR